MQDAIIKFTKEKENGLFLIDMPTGSGKTYQTRQLIKKYILGEALEGVPGIIYCTPLKKNINDIYEELKKDFIRLNKQELFDNNVLRIFANYQCVVDNLLDVEKNITDTLKKKDSFKNLKKKIESYKHFSEIGTFSDILSTTEDEIRREYEPKFRRDLEEEILKNARTLNERKNLINHDYSWVKIIYPSCMIDDRKVIFLSMDKFISGNDPIINKSYRFINSKKIEKYLVFIDEFDATKDVILNQEIANCTDFKLDLAQLFRGIASALKGQSFATQLFEGSDDLNDPKSSRSSFEKMKAKILSIDSQYNLENSFKLEAEKDSDRYFLFDDYKLHTITSSKKGGKITCKTDKKKNQNIIKIVDNDKDDGQFYHSIYGIKGALNYFINCCAMISRNYLNHYNEEAKNNNRDLMEIEQAVSTVIDAFNLDHNVAETLCNMIVDNMTIPYIARQNDKFSTDFYMNGFRYYDFKDDISHDTRTSFMMCYLNNTPEKFILSLSSKVRVVGLSATASIDTVTGNYNLDYLKEKLEKDYYEADEKSLTRIRDMVNKKLDGRYTINVKSQVAERGDIEFITDSLFESKELREKITGILSRHNANEFQMKRFSKLLYSLKDFIHNNKSKVMLSLTNRNLKTDYNYDLFSKDNITEIIKCLSLEENTEMPKIHHLFGADFDEQRNQYINEAAKGHRVILFSSYPAIGTGQNLQYEKLIEDRTETFDIDSLYIENPTNIIVDYKSLREEENLLKYIYQMETLAKNGEIDYFSANLNIKQAFSQFDKPSSFVHFENLQYATKSVNNNIVKILVQAVGRICRTENMNKKHDVNIYVDDDIYTKVDFSVMHGRLMNPEFKKIVSNTRKQLNENERLINLTNKAVEKNNRINVRLEHFLNATKDHWDDSSIEQWNLLRKIVLKYPTISKKQLNTVMKETGIYSLKDMYLEAVDNGEISYYYYCPDIKKIEGTDEEKRPIQYNTNNPNYVLINEEYSRLTQLMRIPEIKDGFEKQGFATSFERNELMILPVVYQNIYKGALGEEAGKILLKLLGADLIEITDPYKFEKFDYVLKENPNVYVDFKNWSELDKVSKDDYFEKCKEKLNKIGGKKAFIINLVASQCVIHENSDIITISSLTKIKDVCVYRLDREIEQRINHLLWEATYNGNN